MKKDKLMTSTGEEVGSRVSTIKGARKWISENGQVDCEYRLGDMTTHDVCFTMHYGGAIEEYRP